MRKKYIKVDLLLVRIHSKQNNDIICVNELHLRIYYYKKHTHCRIVVFREIVSSIQPNQS